MTQPENDNLNKQFGDVLGDLQNLSADIRRQKYPGIAWQKPKTHAAGGHWRIILWPAIAAAVAAVVLLAVMVIPNRGTPIAKNPPGISAEAAAYELKILETLAREKTSDLTPANSTQSSSDYDSLFQQYLFPASGESST